MEVFVYIFLQKNNRRKSCSILHAYKSNNPSLTKLLSRKIYAVPLMSFNYRLVKYLSRHANHVEHKNMKNC